jgi:hypothetical protein
MVQERLIVTTSTSTVISSITIANSKPPTRYGNQSGKAGWAWAGGVCAGGEGGDDGCCGWDDGCAGGGDVAGGEDNDAVSVV